MAITTVAVTKPLVLKTASVVFKLGSTEMDFSDHINQIQFDPSKSSGSPFTSVNGKVINSSSVSTWNVTLGLVQDFADNGFLLWLLANDGAKADITAKLDSAATKSVKATVTLSAASIGGSADGNNLTSTVTLAADGKPVFAA